MENNVVDTRLGNGCKIWNYVNIYGADIGDNVSIGSFTEIGRGVKIGNDVRVGAHCFIPEGVVIEDGVFIGPAFVGTNDKYPPSTKKDWKGIIIKEGASIGAGCVVLPGVTIGKGAKVGAGSVVTKDVNVGEMVVGNPAKRRKK